jgi:hypothetical protein
VLISGSKLFVIPHVKEILAANYVDDRNYIIFHLDCRADVTIDNPVWKLFLYLFKTDVDSLPDPFLE